MDKARLRTLINLFEAEGPGDDIDRHPDVQYALENLEAAVEKHVDGTSIGVDYDSHDGTFRIHVRDAQFTPGSFARLAEEVKAVNDQVTTKFALLDGEGIFKFSIPYLAGL